MARIIITDITPPISDRSHDFSAHVDGKEEEGVSGYGRNAAVAIVNLLELIWDDNDAREDYHAALTALIDLDIYDAEMDGRNSSFILGLKCAKRTIEGAAS